MTKIKAHTINTLMQSVVHLELAVQKLPLNIFESTKMAIGGWRIVSLTIDIA